MKEQNQIIEQIRYNQYKDGVAKKQNAMGYEQAITTLTGIKAGVVDQKFYELFGKSISDYMPVRVGENAFSEELIQYMDYSVAGDFEDGYIDTGKSSARLAEVDSMVDAKRVPVKTWAKKMNYTLVDVEKAQRGVGNAGWSKIVAQEKARKRNFDLGFQQIAFLGAESDTRVKGLLNQNDVTVNATLITKSISSMSATEMTDLLKTLVATAVNNSDDTVMPDRFIIPLTDHLGLDTPYSSQFPTITKRDYLETAFKKATMNEDAKILPVAYADASRNGAHKNIYTMFRYDDEAGRIEMPVPYTSTQVMSQDGFTWQSVAYAQHTGYKQFREKEMIYFQY